MRFVVSPDGVLVPDLRERLPGRGLWIVPRRDMIAAAAKKKLFAKAAKGPVTLPDGLEDQVERLLRQSCLDLVALARKAGEAVAGHDRVRGWLEQGRVALLLEARDASVAGRRRMIGFARALEEDGHSAEGRSGDGIGVIQAFEAATLGQAFGRDQAVHVAIAPGGLAEKLTREAARLEEYMSRDEPPGEAAAGRNAQ